MLEHALIDRLLQMPEPRPAPTNPDIVATRLTEIESRMARHDCVHRAFGVVILLVAPVLFCFYLTVGLVIEAAVKEKPVSTQRATAPPANPVPNHQIEGVSK